MNYWETIHLINVKYIVVLACEKCLSISPIDDLLHMHVACAYSRIICKL